MPDQRAEHRQRLAQIALNEAAFRNLNEQIYGCDRPAAGLPSFSIACECGDGSCLITLTVEAARYENVRADPHRFLVMAGHEDREAETVVERHGGIVVVEKRAVEARRLVEATDPRSTDSPA